MTPLEVLQTYWGYDSFRPKQEEIIRDPGNHLLIALFAGLYIFMAKATKKLYN